ncbi:MAG: stage II sporulation protein P [Oscillospiraceae bacterium]|nr:stage II sporulation protein P [Oscillospiraceae bacterium]
MESLLNQSKTRLKRFAAGTLAAVVPPVAAFSVNDNMDAISGAVGTAADYIIHGENASDGVQESELRYINNGDLLLYVPDSPDSPDIPDSDDLPDSDEPPPFTDAETVNNPALQVLSRNISDEREDFDKFTSKDGKVTRMTFRPEQSVAYLVLDGGGRVRNATQIDDDVFLNVSRQPLIWTPELNGEPEVLILHTHTAESFVSDDGVYDTDFRFRSNDSSRNIVAVGAKIAEEIAKSGVGVIHDGTMHDYPVFAGCYNRSSATIDDYLKEYPSIKVVLDIHRDGIEDGGNPVAAVAEIDGRDAAQIMIISPADDGEWNVPNFMENFKFAGLLQSQIESDNAGLTRAVLLQYCNYNLDQSPGALLIEVGSHGNTLEQALYAGELLGKSLGRLLVDLGENV